MKLTNTEILALTGSSTMGIAGALTQLHGQVKPIFKTEKVGESEVQNPTTNEKGQIATEVVPYDFAPNTRMKLAVLMKKIQPLAEAFEESRTEVVSKYKKLARESAAEAIKEAQAGGKTLSVSAVKNMTELNTDNSVWSAFNKEIVELMRAEQEISGWSQIPEADLKVDDNDFPQMVIMALLPIMKTKAEPKATEPTP